MLKNSVHKHQLMQSLEKDKLKDTPNLRKKMALNKKVSYQETHLQITKFILKTIPEQNHLLTMPSPREHNPTEIYNENL